jgi:hypothetical protein
MSIEKCFSDLRRREENENDAKYDERGDDLGNGDYLWLSCGRGRAAYCGSNQISILSISTRNEAQP